MEARSHGSLLSSATMGLRCGALVIVAMLSSACAVAVGSQGEAPMRSPTLDYPLPDVTTADGTPLGADRMRIEDKLQTSPRVGTGGFIPAALPASIERLDEPLTTAPINDDPLCDVLGVRRSVLRRRCPQRAVP